ncbi:hypothetical protein N7497_003063 [Penicillium chrysogenum]|nr:hypothetical protein N7497_003063 [Penicillium chrysogenum]
MQSVTPGTNQIQAPAAQQIQQPINQQLQGSPAPVQQPAPQMQTVYPITSKERMQYFMHQTQQLQGPAAQQVQQPINQQLQGSPARVQQSTPQMQALYPTPPKERMRSFMHQTQQLRGSPARVQQPTPPSAGSRLSKFSNPSTSSSKVHRPEFSSPPPQMQAIHPTTPKERMQYFMHQTQQLQSSAAQQVQQPTHQMQAVYPMPPKERMQSMMQQTQQLQASSQQVQQRTHQMQGIYSTPTKERKQSVSSLSAASPRKRTFEFMENIVPSNFVANPDNHARWTVSPNGDRTYLNGPQMKKARVSRK